MAKAGSQPEKLFEKLRKGTLQNVYFITGEEDYLRDRAVMEVLNRAVDPAWKDFNLNVYQGGDVDIKHVLGQIQALPMMSERRVVLVRNVNQIDSASQQMLARYVSLPVDTTVLVLEAPDLPAKSPLLGPLKAKDAIYKFGALYEDKIQHWIQVYVKRQGKEIEVSAVHDLVEIAGIELKGLSNELDKLVLFCGSKKIITAEDVHKAIGISRQFNIFELDKSIGEKNLAKSLHILCSMIVQGENPAGIVVRLTHYLTILWKLKARNWNVKQKAEAAKYVGVHPHFIEEYLSAAGRYSESQLESGFHYLRMADLQIKRSALNISLTLSVPIVALIRNDILKNSSFNLAYE